MISKGKALYSGKAKTLFETNDEKVLYCEFRDDISAFNAEKVANLSDKGKINNYINAFLMQYLQANGIKTHFIERVSETASLFQKLTMLPLECVVRNRAAGSICKRLGIAKNTVFNPPIFEFFYKDDSLGDPLINESHIISCGFATKEQMAKMYQLTHAVNNVLSPLLLEKGFLLVDYKLEFGLIDGEIILADEFTPDGCRLWDAQTLEIFDKDRFRQDLGDVVAHYQLVAERLGVSFSA